MSHRTSKWAILVLLLLTGLYAVSRTSRDSASPERASTRHAARANSAPAGKLSTATGDHFRQFVRRGRDDEQHSLPPNGVFLINREKDPASLQWRQSTFWYGASFEVVRISPRTANDCLVLGRFRDGNTVVERWVFTPQVGSNTITRPVAPTPVGVAYNGLTRQAESVVGGTWIDPDLRSAEPSDRRIFIEAQNADNPVTMTAIDPDGRFVILMDGHGLRQVGMNGDPIGVIATFDQLAGDAPFVNSLSISQHVSEGRILVGRTHGYNPRVDYVVVFVDHDNDGVFEHVHELDYESYKVMFGTYRELVDDY